MCSPFNIYGYDNALYQTHQLWQFIVVWTLDDLLYPYVFLPVHACGRAPPPWGLTERATIRMTGN